MPCARSRPRWRGQPRPLHCSCRRVRPGKAPTLILPTRVVARFHVQLRVSLTRRARTRGLGGGTGTVTTGAVVVVVVVTGGAGGVGAGQPTGAGALGATETPDPLW